MQPPPGGPPDAAPPKIVSVFPDSGTVAEGLDDAAVFRFDEVIDERSGGGLDRLVTVSPVPEEVEIDWKRSAIAVRPKGGWRQGVVYHVTLLPGVQDLRNNRLVEGRTIVFTTGGPLPNARITGTVVDWEAGRLAPRARVEGILLPDSLVYVTLADSTGSFTLSTIPVGAYLVVAAVDANNNRRREPREPFDSATVRVDSVVDRVFWAFRQDTLGPQLARATLLDSVTVRIEFNQALPPEDPDSGSVQMAVLPDSLPVAVEAVWRESVYDSVKTAARGRPDTVAADTTRIGPAAAPAARDTTRAAQILRQRPKLSTNLIVRTASPLAPGTRYLITATARNLIGATATSRTVLVIPPRAERPPQ